MLLVGNYMTVDKGHESATYKVMETPHGPLYRGFRRMLKAMTDEGERTV